MTTQIKRSRTGTYHKGSSGSQHAYCNQRLNVTIARATDVRKAGSACFCEKCFGDVTDREDLLARYEATA